MIDYLEGIDRMIVLTVNGWSNSFLDAFFWFISQRITWIPLYILIAFFAWKTLPKKQLVIFVILTILCVALADLVSVHLFKNVFLRYRPSHHADLTERLHFYLKANGEFYKGGMYGFVSSHAANFFALATFVSLSLNAVYPKLKWFLFSIAFLVSFSRLYQGVHYASDLFAGALLGISIAFILYRFVYLKWINKG
ncbi:MAG: phosphatase PAP2 family protein [Crocinitomicaceae bacterium]|nr:phosphatase PAP2 family protein [Crocinitomicaceae bacterium]